MRGSIEQGADLLEHAFLIRQNVVIPKPLNTKTARREISIAAVIARAFRVLAAVGFNYKHVLETDEVDDPGTNWNLTPKFNIRELA